MTRRAKATFGRFHDASFSLLAHTRGNVFFPFARHESEFASVRQVRPEKMFATHRGSVSRAVTTRAHRTRDSSLAIRWRTSTRSPASRAHPSAPRALS
jgi:hypothetical protein